MAWGPSQDNWRWKSVRSKNGGVEAVNGYPMKKSQKGVVAVYIRFTSSHQRTRVISTLWHACILLQYDFVWVSCNMPVRGIYDMDNDEGIEISRVTGHTLLQYDDAFWNKLLWLVWYRSSMKMTGKQLALVHFSLWFFDFFLILNKCDHIKNTRRCGYASTDT